MTSRRPPAGADLTVYASGLAAGLWVLLAWLNPDNTYHLAPPLIAGIFPVAQRFRLGPLPPLTAFGAALGGLLNAFLVTGVLSVVGKLKGPSLLPFGGPAVEALIFATVGAAIGGLVALARLRR